MNKNPGFTIIELVVVIVLIGIIGLTAFSRFTSPNAFNEAAASDALITTIRAAQQASLGRSSVTFEINTVADDWQFVAKSGGTAISTTTVSTSDVKLETGSAAVLAVPTDSCAAGTSFDTPVNNFVITFDNRGNIASFSNATVGTENISGTFNGVRICVNDMVEASVCVSPAGYAYSGDCDV